jgi:cardiolipin synthase (CMP-forming)
MNLLRDKSLLSIPNILSFYRIITFPLVLYFAISHRELIYFVLLAIDLITDVLDGYLARKLKLETEFGAKLDALADIGMYILAFIGLLCFKGEVLQPYLTSFYIFLGVFILPKIIAYARFRSFPGLHLYTSKVGGYLQGFFFLSLFTIGFYPLFYYIMIIEGIISFVEQAIIVSILPELKTNVKGLYWLLKDK